MKFASWIARIILGLPYTVLGFNGLYFTMTGQWLIEAPDMPEPAAAFMGAMMTTGYLFTLVKLTEFAGGLLVLSGVMLPLGLTVLAPVTINILCFHYFLAPDSIVLPLVMGVAQIFLAYAYRNNFRSLFENWPYLSA